MDNIPQKPSAGSPGSVLFVTGLIASLVVVVLMSYAAWKTLVAREAVHEGEKLVRGLIATVAEVDRETTQALNGEFIAEWNGKTLFPPPAPVKNRLQNLNGRLKKITGVTDGVISLFTDCPATHSSDCFIDLDNKARDTRHFEPKSRPWYLATRAHEDWILQPFLRHRDTQRTGALAWGWILSKRLVPERIPSDNSTRENGIWVNFVMPENDADGAPYSHPVFKMALSAKPRQFSAFSVDMKALRFPRGVLTSTSIPDVQCRASTDPDFWKLTYASWVHCELVGQQAQFSFMKEYDIRSHALMIIAAALTFFLIAMIFLRRSATLEKIHVEDRLKLARAEAAAKVGAELVHDFKKSILAQLNFMPQNYSGDWDSSWDKNSFRENLRRDLSQHFQALAWLNKHVALLQNSLKRHREKNWVTLDAKLLRLYFNWLLIAPEIFSSETPSEHVLNIRIVPGDTPEVHLHENRALAFMVPEMGFYRVIQNLWENYLAYGTGEFNLTVMRREERIRIVSANRISERRRQEDGTGLGFLIVRQILEDNFGAQVITETSVVDDVFTVTLEFNLNTPSANS